MGLGTRGTTQGGRGVPGGRQSTADRGSREQRNGGDGASQGRAARGRLSGKANHTLSRLSFQHARRQALPYPHITSGTEKVSTFPAVTQPGAGGARRSLTTGQCAASLPPPAAPLSRHRPCHHLVDVSLRLESLRRCVWRESSEERGALLRNLF